MANNIRPLALPPRFPDNLDHLIAVPRPRRVGFLPEVIIRDRRNTEGDRGIALQDARASESSGEEKSYEPEDIRTRKEQMGGSKRRRKNKRTSKRRRITRRRASRRHRIRR